MRPTLIFARCIPSMSNSSFYARRCSRRARKARATTSPPMVIAVTVLTSFTPEGLMRTGVSGSVADQVRRLALLAQESGMDGVVASPQEIELIRGACDPRFAIVTPGIRAAGDARGDQNRTASAAGAMAAGASYVVVGRPIIEAADPRAAALRIVEECTG